MLKALELIGFKSFADKTQFAFPPAVTVVVGPNGSGKSNIVDAIKWVLGAQSVKSLRGKEMADVIFNGSAARRPMNSAEVTLTFDNSEHRLTIDSPEVAITRRVYRSGEGEYLINRQPCRLRDIRDLFAGTGIATEAYSVIEQGKVDIMLQASPRDRRAIFEEAAGISRFKAKKLEAARRLERVDQNLLRLSDIVDEVDSRLRSVRMQATKARRYRDYSNRLQDLRTHVGLTDWRELTEQLSTLQSDLSRWGTERDELAARMEAMEAESLALETKASDGELAIRESEAVTAKNRERITAKESTIEHQRSLGCDMEEQVARLRRQLDAMSTRAGDLQHRLYQTEAGLQSAETSHAAACRRLDEKRQSLSENAARLDQLQMDHDVRRSEHMELMRSIAKLGNQLSAARTQASAAEEVRDRCHNQIAELEQEQKTRGQQLEVFRQGEESLGGQVVECEAQLQQTREALAHSRQEAAQAQKQLVQLQGRHTGASERAAVLTDLEHRLEGISSGVKQTLVKARQDPDGPYRQIRGLVADLLRVEVQTAPLVEIALGEFAQYLVLAPGDAFVQHIQQQTHGFQGRVGFIRMDVDCPPDRVQLDGKPGVVGRADRFVETSAEFVPLVRRLLGRTFFVEELSQALALSKSHDGLCFVTMAGELVASQGTLVVGPRHLTTGLISRRSELRALNHEIEELSNKIEQAETAVVRLDELVAQQDQQLNSCSEKHTRLSKALAEYRLKTASAQERLEQLDRQHATLTSERRAASAQIESASQLITKLTQSLEQSELQLARREAQIATDAKRLEEIRAELSQYYQQATSCEVELAKSEQRLDSLRNQMDQFQRDHEERNRALSDIRNQLEQCLRRAQKAQQNILQLESDVAELYLVKEELAAQVVFHRNELEACRTNRATITSDVQDVRQKLRALEKAIYENELQASQMNHKRLALAEHMREDYDIELADVQHAPSDEELRQREEVEQEIAELRQKINNIGSVNLDALEELEQLESRYGSLSEQYQDLAQAKGSLEQIISKINADSRRLFADTLDSVRGHFQSLFRKLFGGGQADIVLDGAEDADILESGIEIVARPPGKEPRSISLLSGGEKTLTCVALLLAIFRSRPSPFCVLDEVDAALDEANIERFIGVLTEFLGSTQFIVVTHSKKTMTAANTLYGITMQESGISKRVSVRFEDVSEDGHTIQAGDSAKEADAEDEGIQAA